MTEPSQSPEVPRGDWLSVRVRPGSWPQAVVSALFRIGSHGIEEIGEELTTLLPGDTNPDDVVCAVLAASPDARVQTAFTPAVDWSERWRDGIHVQELGSLVIAPPWLAGSYDQARMIVIDPGMAFGTGEHATTRGVVRLLPSVLRVGDHVADLGAGSAVLSIAAAKLGAARVVAIEIDPDAIGNAEENVLRNEVASRVSVLEGDAEVLLPLVAPVRLILANIISSVLVSLLPAISGALTSDGQAIISGILLEEREDMVSVLDANGWRVEAEDREEIWWSAVIARR